ncbi:MULTISPECIES: TetR/AcrR family transcriptional regulator [Bacillaceae]|uniref:TetR/AcrR family transcriptional regulator n=1 Tax=Bacillaceae TaxID=186817 RepID=UPI000C7785F5|nr:MULTISPECIES: TetR/AcrR family transcriptional regulator [Bacillaceae]PLR67254.1 hypothetical protein CYJ36_14905 [Bacillus sp. UMB0893]QNG60424.1 TetR/AcrR family transcriptional regulator [Bacillus sp. PAMC26568]
MPRAFTDEEKQRIRQTLIKKGKELLANHGIRKTNVEDLTIAAGISKGAFYKFYPSKEALFFEILEGLENDMRTAFFSEFLVPGLTPRESFQSKMHRVLSFIEENPLMGKMNSEEMNHLLRTLPKEMLEAHSKNDDRELSAFVKSWKDEGYLRDFDQETVAAFLKSMFILALQKQEIGPEYDRMMKMMIDMAGQYLIRD